MIRDNNLGPLLIILFVLVLSVSLYAIREDRWPGLPWSLGVAPTKFTLVFEAKVGEVVPGFPLELIGLTKDTKIEKSAKYSVEEAIGRSEVLTTTYSTEASVSELFAAYVEYLNENGYTILKTNANSGHSVIEATSGGQVVSVDMSVSTRTKKQVRVDVRSGVIQ